MDVEITSQAVPDGVRLQIEGKIILGSTQYFEKDITKNGFEGNHKVIELDMGNVSHIDSAGMGALMRLHQEARNHGKELVVVALSKKLESLFELTRLNKFLNVKA